MPNIKNKTTTIIERTKVQTSKGEVTINLNLSIKIEGGQISVNTSASEEVNEEKKRIDPVLGVPEEAFDMEIPVLANFGKTS